MVIGMARQSYRILQCIAVAACVVLACGELRPRRTVAITAATSSQGRGAVDYFVNHAADQFDVRAIIRNSSSDAARELTGLPNVAVVEVDLFNIDAVVTALSFVDDLILITMSDFGGDGEELVVATVAAAATAAGIERIVFSSGDNTTVPALSTKFRLENVLQMTAPFARHLFLRSALFYDTFVQKGAEKRVGKRTIGGNSNSSSTATTTSKHNGAGMRTPADDGEPASSYVFSLNLAPDVAVPMIAPADIGAAAAHALCYQAAEPASVRIAVSAEEGAGAGTGDDAAIQDQRPPLEALEFFNAAHPTVFELAGDLASPLDFVREFTAVTGQHAAYERSSLDELDACAAAASSSAAGHGGRAAMCKGVADMYRWYQDGHPGHARDPARSRSAFPAVIRTLRRWMEDEGGRLAMGTSVEQQGR